MKRLNCLLAGLALALSAIPALAQDAPPDSRPMVQPVECCDFCCPADCPRGGLTASAGFMILKPHWANNPAIIAEAPIPLSDGTNLRQHDFDMGAQFVPQVSLGYVGPGGLGGRVSWYGFAIYATERLQTQPGLFLASAAPLRLQLQSADPLELLTHSKLQMDVWDFQVVKHLNLQQVSLVLVGGVRYAHVSQNYDAQILGSPDTQQRELQSGHNFNGGGPLLGLESRCPVGDSNLYLLGNTRAAILVGASEQSAFRDILEPNNDSVALYETHNSTIRVGELEIGAGFQRLLGGRRVFVEAALVGMMWWDAGNASRTGTTLSGASISNPQNDDLVLFGGRLTAGLDF